MTSRTKTNSLTKDDLNKIADLLDNQFDKRIKPFVQDEVSGLKNYVKDGIETIMDGIDDLYNGLETKEKIDHLTNWARQVSKKVDVKIDI